MNQPITLEPRARSVRATVSRPVDPDPVRAAPPAASVVAGEPEPVAEAEHELARNSGVTLLARATMALSRGVSLVLISRACGAAAFGNYSVVLTSFAVASGLGTLGLDQANIYFTGTRRAPMAALVRNSLWAACIVGAVVGAALLGVAWLFRSRIFAGVPADAILATAVCLPFVLLQNYTSGIVLGRSWFQYASACDVAKWFLHLAMVAMFAATGRLGILQALLALYVPIGLAGLVHVLVITRRGRIPLGELLGLPDAGVLRMGVSYGARAGVLGFVQVLRLRLDVYVLKYFAPGPAVGHYALATSVADVILYGARSVGLAVFVRRARRAWLEEETLPRLTAVIGGFVAIVAGCVALLRDVGVGVFFGPEYVPSSLAVAYRLPGIVAESMALVLVGDCLGRCRPNPAIWAGSVVVAVAFVLNLLLVPAGGIAAAAIAFSIASWMHAIVVIAVHRGMSRQPIASYLVPGRRGLRVLLGRPAPQGALTGEVR